MVHKEAQSLIHATQNKKMTPIQHNGITRAFELLN